MTESDFSQRIDQRPAMTVLQVAERLAVSKNTVYAMLNNGQLPYMRFGPKRGSIRIRPEDLEVYEKNSLISGEDNSEEDVTTNPKFNHSQVAKLCRARLK